MAVTPGPGIAYVVARTVAGGRAEGLASCLGTGLGGLLHVVAAALGLSLLLGREGIECTIGMAGIIDQTPLTYENGLLVLTIPRAYAALDGERLRRRFEALADLLGKKPKIRISG